ncbi:hypothetical protein ID866_9855, partial [Astraeus odoratus]
MVDFEQDIIDKRAKLKSCSRGDPRRDAILYSLALSIWERFRKQGDIADLDEAIMLNREALELRQQGHPDRSSSLHLLALCLGSLFAKQKQGSMTTLEEAITLHRLALELRPPGHPDRARSLHGLAFCLWQKFEKCATIADLNEAIILGQSVLELRPPGHTERNVSLYNLADYLRRRAEKQGSAADLDEAIKLHRAALKLRPPGHHSRFASLSRLAACLKDRFDNKFSITDLDEAIECGRAALELRPPTHPEHAISLGRLVSYIRTKFAKQGVVPDLEEAIAHERSLLKLHPAKHPGHAIALKHVVTYTRIMFEKQGVLPDLEMAIASERDALELFPFGSSDRAASLIGLALYLTHRFRRQGHPEDSDEATVLAREGLKSHGPDHPRRSASLHVLALCLSDRFTELDESEGLEEAIRINKAALELRPSGHADRSSSLHELAFCLWSRYQKHGIAADLDEAITHAREVLNLRPHGHPDHSSSLDRLAIYLQAKISKQDASPVDIDTTFSPSRVGEVIRDVISETLKTFPIRLLNTRSGILCDRSAQIAHFERSHEYEQLLSSAASGPCDKQIGRIRAIVSTYFEYATLSHRWGKHEPLLRDVEGRAVYDIPGMDGVIKLKAFCVAACQQGYQWGWVDTCCIDKDSSAELQEAIGSMFTWYRQSALTIVYLSDVTDSDTLSQSVWLTRGWTLQELLAPRRVLFYTQKWTLYKNPTSSNHKTDRAIVRELEKATSIASQFLVDFQPGVDKARSRLQWASRRYTTRSEDIAYALFGIFNLHLPVLYGESTDHALGRLLAEIISKSGDVSILDWVGPPSSFHSCFPANITPYQMPPLRPSLPNLLSPSSMTRIRKLMTLKNARRLHRMLAALPHPQFVNCRLSLPCMVHRVKTVQLKRVDGRSENL